MTTDSASVPRYLADPVAVIVEAVAAVEPGLDPALIATVADAVTTTRPGRRRLAQAVAESPALLTCGLPEGPPLVDRLIRALREQGAVTVVQPCCPSCGKPAQRMSSRDENGVRRCVTCANRATGVFAPRPCAVCGRVLIPRSYDRDGLPRCELCPPDPGVDHIEWICDAIAVVDPDADRDRVRELVVATVRQPARRRQVAWALDDRPELLTGAAAEGTQMVRRLVTALAAAGVAVVSPQCPMCGRTRPVISMWEGKPCCFGCYQRARAQPCARCGHVRSIVARTADGQPLCEGCARQEPFNKEVCTRCGQLAAVASRPGGHPVCDGCHEMPAAVCSVCGRYKPCRFPDSAAPRCVNCSARARTADCARCGKHYPIGGRDSAGNPLCANCARRWEPCCRCGRLLPVHGRVSDGAVCWTCIKAEPEYHRGCADCGAVVWVHHGGLCDRCAAPKVLDAAIAGPDGAVRAELEPVRRALAAGDPRALLNWLNRRSVAAMLGRLAVAEGPVTHDTLEEIAPARRTRYLRQLLIAHDVLPDRDRQLDHLERWLPGALAEVADTDERRLLRSYLTWTHLRRLRRAPSPASPLAVASIRGEVKSSVKLLAWLRAREQTLASCTQADIDVWCEQGGHMPRRARHFLAWCSRRGHTARLIMAAPAKSEHRAALGERRWQLARRLLHDDSFRTADRVSGLLILLYGQPVARIVCLTTADVTQTGDRVQLRLGRQPLTIASPLDRLLVEQVDIRRGKAALGHLDDHNQWLFPGGLPGTAMHPTALASRLRRIGVPCRAGRNTALADHAAVLPAKVLSDLLGLSVTSAIRWAKIIDASGGTYAAELNRRHPSTRTNRPPQN
ncbi:hypothetical protein J2W56_004244 [Nocardia kruczakiae]|uniref:Site-specific recombinase XerD n=1 Tax=Nocardia kruczakiae TaxID=261477 RepID=A0ABU1XIW5_9NOCA|nr:hypothetical protein [Nocardia kruczakiae]MDR7170493.1 hypothetical protein [Nocardia kruczakiae]